MNSCVTLSGNSKVVTPGDVPRLFLWPTRDSHHCGIRMSSHSSQLWVERQLQPFGLEMELSTSVVESIASTQARPSCTEYSRSSSPGPQAWSHDHAPDLNRFLAVALRRPIPVSIRACDGVDNRSRRWNPGDHTRGSTRRNRATDIRMAQHFPTLSSG